MHRPYSRSSNHFITMFACYKCQHQARLANSWRVEVVQHSLPSLNTTSIAYGAHNHMTHLQTSHSRKTLFLSRLPFVGLPVHPQSYCTAFVSNVCIFLGSDARVTDPQTPCMAARHLLYDLRISQVCLTCTALVTILRVSSNCWQQVVDI